MIARTFTATIFAIIIVHHIVTTNVTFVFSEFSYAEINKKATANVNYLSATPLKAQLAKAKHKSSNILFVGDVMLARNVEFLMKKNGINYPFSRIDFSDFSPSPYVVGNFEAAIPVNHVHTEPRQLQFSVTTNQVEGLFDAGFTHLSLANNHSFDFGKNNFEHTVSTLKSKTIEPFGHPKITYKDSVSIVQTSDVTTALIAIHVLEKDYSDNEIKALFDYATANSDIQIVYVHWGEEYSEKSSKRQQATAKVFVKHGADMIVGHHPHVVQEIGLVDGVPVFYSLGNYIFDQYFSEVVQEGLLLNVDFSVGNPTITLIPVSSTDKLSSPAVMKTEAYQLFLSKLATISDPHYAPYISQGVLPLQLPFATSTKIAMIDE